MYCKFSKKIRIIQRPDFFKKFCLVTKKFVVYEVGGRITVFFLNFEMSISADFQTSGSNIHFIVVKTSKLI